jgi:hypothetical protein
MLQHRFIEHHHAAVREFSARRLPRGGELKIEGFVDGERVVHATHYSPTGAIVSRVTVVGGDLGEVERVVRVAHAGRNGQGVGPRGLKVTAAPMYTSTGLSLRQGSGPDTQHVLLRDVELTRLRQALRWLAEPLDR